MSKPVEGFYEAAKYLGQFLPEKEALLPELACMGDEERLIVSILSYFKEIKETTEEEKTELKELIKLIKHIGFANWKRDIVTDMAIKIGKHEEIDSFDTTDTEETPSNSP